MTGSLTTRRATAYLPAVDGLRALAIAGVFLYHAHSGWLPGGFLGVDLFFVISGFLITRGLLHERGERGRVDLRRFWVRRARRLLPAAFAFLVVVLVAAQVAFPGEVRSLRGVALAAVGYVTNWYLVFSNQPYFERVGHPQLLQHLWSLAVEEQFYLVWPPLFVLALRLARPAVVCAGTLLLGAGSVLLMATLYRQGADVSRLYYGTDTHAVGLLAGAALAFAEPVWARWNAGIGARAVQVAGVAALGALVFLFAWLAEWRPLVYEGGFALAAAASAALIVAAATPGPFARVAGSTVLRWVGVRSYGIYLWHPVLLALVAAPGLPVPPSAIALAAAVLTVIVADLSYRYVEMPVRTGAAWRLIEEFRTLRRDTRWAVTGAGIAAGVALALGLVLAPPPSTPVYLAVPQISGVLTAPAHVEAAPGAPSWVVTRDSAAGSAAEPVSRSVVPAASPAGVTVRSLSAVVTATPTPAEPMPADGATPDLVVAAATPAPTPASGGAPPLALGDSVMLGAAEGLAQAFGTIEVDAAVGRDVTSTVRLLRERRAANRLPDTVILQVGDNGPISRPQMEEIMQLLSGVRRVVVIDLHVPQPWEGPNNAMLADAVSRYPNARLAAWHAASASRPELFWDDLHLRSSGVALYISLIVAGLR